MAESPTGSPREKAVVCLSGGMDSTVCAALAARDYDAYAVHFSYGQRTEQRELESASAVAETLGFRQFLPLRMDLFRQIGGKKMAAAYSIPALRSGKIEDPVLYGDDMVVVEQSGSKTIWRRFIESAPALGYFSLIL